MATENDFLKMKRKGLNPVSCQHESEKGYCGAYATQSLEMPPGIPDMPLCGKHKKELEGVDVMAEFISLLIEAMGDTDGPDNRTD